MRRLSRAVDVKGVRLVTLRADSMERGQLRTLVDNLKVKLGGGRGGAGLSAARGQGGADRRCYARAGETRAGGQAGGRGWPSWWAARVGASRRLPKQAARTRRRSMRRSRPHPACLESCWGDFNKDQHQGPLPDWKRPLVLWSGSLPEAEAVRHSEGDDGVGLQRVEVVSVLGDL